MAIAVIAMIGIIFAAVVNLAEKGIGAVALTWMVIVGLGTVIALVAMIFHQLSRMFLVSQQKVSTAAVKPQIAGEFSHSRPGALPEHMPSVTEHTTRTFDHIYREPVEKEK
jgi:hypothetical protein